MDEKDSKSVADTTCCNRNFDVCHSLTILDSCRRASGQLTSISPSLLPRWARQSLDYVTIQVRYEAALCQPSRTSLPASRRGPAGLRYTCGADRSCTRRSTVRSSCEPPPSQISGTVHLVPRTKTQSSKYIHTYFNEAYRKHCHTPLVLQNDMLDKRPQGPPKNTAHQAKCKHDKKQGPQSRKSKKPRTGACRRGA
jgi:hypothetical protein